MRSHAASSSLPQLISVASLCHLPSSPGISVGMWLRLLLNRRLIGLLDLSAPEAGLGPLLVKAGILICVKKEPTAV